MKLIIAGPPHSGKSVFISALKTELEKRDPKLFPLNLDATPDGETNYVKENYAVDEDLANALRKKGAYTDKLREYFSRCISNSSHPLMLIDIGGKFNDKDKPMLKNATHALILSGGEIVGGENRNGDNFENDFNKSVAEWTEFFESMGIKVIANVFSDFHAKNDYVAGDGSADSLSSDAKNLPNGTLAIHHLERSDLESQGRIADEAREQRTNVAKVAEIIIAELKNLSEFESFEKVSAKKERRWEKKDTGFEGPETYDRPDASEISEFDVVYAGGFSGHQLAQKMIADLKNNQKVHFLDSKLGEKIEIRSLKIGRTDRRWFDEPEYIGCHFGKKIFQIRTLTNRSQKILLPEDLENMQVPEVPENSIVKIANSGTQWFGAIVAASYVNHCSAVGISNLVDKTQNLSAKTDGENSETKTQQNAKQKPKKKKLPATVIVWSKLDSLPTVKDDKRLTDKRLTDKSDCIILDKPIVYLDMDGVLADFDGGKDRMLEKHPEFREQFKGKFKNMPGLFESLEPVDGAIETAKWICENFNAFILTAAPWDNPTALQAKQDWIKRHFEQSDENGKPFNPFKRKLIISHHKEQLIGDILIDDRNTNGVHDFKGTHIWFGEKPFENWEKIKSELEKQIQK